MNYYNNTDIGVQSGVRLDLTAVMRQVYLWMFLGLMATAGTAFAISTTNLPTIMARNPLIFIAAIIVEFGLVLFLSARIATLNPTTATILFLAYAVVNGVTLSLIFLAYSGPTHDYRTIAYAAIATSAMFGVTSILAYTTRMDLSRLGGILMMAVIGLVVATIINIFVSSDALFWIINYAGVLIFVGLTAYDTQRIKDMAMNVSVNAGGEMATVQRVAIMGALRLYLDFINLFLFTLRIMGGRGRR